MDQQGANRLLEQSFQLWFRPEIERRKSTASLPNGFSIWAGQVIMDLELDAPIIRLNEEVRGVLSAKAARPITAGEAVSLNDFQNLQGMTLGNEFPNAGHLSAILHKNIWYIFFDFQYNAARIKTQLSSADQFLQAANFCVDTDYSIAAIDNLYDAVQLMAKCFLLTLPDKRVLDSKSHGFIETNFNLQDKFGNVPPASVQLLNRLADIRPKTRYAVDPMKVSQNELRQYLDDAKEMRRQIEIKRPKRNE